MWFCGCLTILGQTRGRTNILYYTYISAFTAGSSHLALTNKNLGSFMIRQPTQLTFLSCQKLNHSVRIHLTVLAQDPPDCFANKELLFMHSLATEIKHELSIDHGLVLQLSKDCHASDPHVLVANPLMQFGLKIVLQGDSSYQVDTDGITEIPPHVLFANHALKETHRLDSNVALVLESQVNRKILFLTMRQSPKRLDARLIHFHRVHDNVIMHEPLNL
mmetsp:Transcript_18928/g.31333  ORF Transcript_18928/g.31333 Transcript_18928/m.31333 type:complete len:219 (+) Transcript_18928:58-714(+)